MLRSRRADRSAEANLDLRGLARLRSRYLPPVCRLRKHRAALRARPAQRQRRMALPMGRPASASRKPMVERSVPATVKALMSECPTVHQRSTWPRRSEATCASALTLAAAPDALDQANSRPLAWARRDSNSREQSAATAAAAARPTSPAENSRPPRRYRAGAAMVDPADREAMGSALVDRLPTVARPERFALLPAQESPAGRRMPAEAAWVMDQEAMAEEEETAELGRRKSDDPASAARSCLAASSAECRADSAAASVELVHRHQAVSQAMRSPISRSSPPEVRPEAATEEAGRAVMVPAATAADRTVRAARLMALWEALDGRRPAEWRRAAGTLAMATEAARQEQGSRDLSAEFSLADPARGMDHRECRATARVGQPPSARAWEANCQSPTRSALLAARPRKAVDRSSPDRRVVLVPATMPQALRAVPAATVQVARAEPDPVATAAAAAMETPACRCRLMLSEALRVQQAPVCHALACRIVEPCRTATRSRSARAASYSAEQAAAGRKSLPTLPFAPRPRHSAAALERAAVQAARATPIPKGAPSKRSNSD